MKRLSFITISLLLITTISSCNKELELLPNQSVEEEIALNSDANVKSVLLGAYDEISQFQLYGGNIFLLSEMLSANREIRWQGTYNQPGEVYNKGIFVNNTYVTGIWTQAYKVINIANNILNALDVVNEESRDQVRGEALFLRGSMYFELVKLYALPYSAGNTESNLGVPLVLTPTDVISDENKVARNTVAEVYAQIVSDLEEADGLLPATNEFFATSIASAAMLSRVYLQMEDFAKAGESANRAIETATTNDLSLMSSYAAAFNNTSNSNEDIFAMQVSAQDGDNYMHMFYSIPAYGGRDGDIAVLPAHLALYETGDARRAFFYEYSDDARVGKWRDQYRNVKVIRLAEMYLTRAEANFREGTAIGATPLADINRIRERVNLTSLSSLSLADILKERKLELAHEGHTIHDVKRTRGSILDNSNASTTVFNYDSPQMVFPIPQREMDANNNLIQNPGYN